MNINNMPTLVGIIT